MYKIKTAFSFHLRRLQFRKVQFIMCLSCHSKSTKKDYEADNEQKLKGFNLNEKTNKEFCNGF